MNATATPFDRCVAVMRIWRDSDHSDSLVMSRNEGITVLEGIYALRKAAGVPETADVEAAAKAIYDLLPYSEKHPPIKPPWIPGGNSLKQDEARRYARAALSTSDRSTP